MSLISREYARSLLTELAHGATVPLDLDELVEMPRLRWHGHVFVGDIALRCYKHRSRWWYEERDIRRAGQALAEFTVDRDDVVAVQLPPYRDHGERDLEDWGRPDWRRQLVSWMFHQARRQMMEREGRSYDDWGSWTRIGDNGLPGELMWEDFVARSSLFRSTQNIASVRILELLTWSGSAWLLPRACVELLDRWEQREDELIGRVRLCSLCGVPGPMWGLPWRRSTAKGYVTMCPPCSGASFRLYGGHLRGVLYDSPRRRGTRADEYVCRLCGEARASAWDHCHDHGYVRGPLCSGCNTRECKAPPDWFLRDPASVLHLLECHGCREQRTLPRRFHTGVIPAHLAQTERHGRCSRQPYARELEDAHGVARFALSCDKHITGEWTKDVTRSEVAALVHAFVDIALAAPQVVLPVNSNGAGSA